MMRHRLRVLVLGGRGFVGSAVCELLRKRHNVTTFDRHAGKKGHHITGNVLHLPDVVHAAKGMDAVINLVGLSPLTKPKGETYHQIHVQAVRYVLEACKRNKIKKLVHLSALGADKRSPIEYLKTKGLGEELVLQAKLPATVLCPSIIFDENSEIVRMAKRLRWCMAFPNIPARVQPVYRQDIAKLCRLAVEEKISERRLEVGGPHVMTFFETVKKIFNSQGFPCIPLPAWLWDWELDILASLNVGGLSKDQVALLFMDNIVKENRIPPSIRLVSLDSWLRRSNKG